MSFIMQTIKCRKCGHEMNIATGTFGYGVPKACPQCEFGRGFTKEQFYDVISQGWNAKEENPSR
jgi:hypothetical protein